MILGSTLHLRTDSLSGSLISEVYAVWGPPGRQAPPRASYHKVELTDETTIEQTSTGSIKRTVQHETKVDVPVVLDTSKVHATIALEQKRKGLMWFPTYGVAFDAKYTFANDALAAHDVQVHFPLRSPANDDGRGAISASGGSFDGFGVTDGAGRPIAFDISGDEAVFSDHFAAGERRYYGISYRTRGTSSFRYLMTQGSGRVHDLDVDIDTNFTDVDFPTDTLSPTARTGTPSGWRGTWHFSSLVSTSAIGIDLPQLLNPGPLATKVTLFAPVSLLFFFFVVAVLSQARGLELHPMHYFLLSCAFFAFHLLFAYMVDHWNIVPSFAIAASVSVFLVVSYARLFVGWRFALREMGLSQLLYLVLFSATFFWDGFTGLAIAIGATATLFFVMQVTGRTAWRDGAPGVRTREKTALGIS
jgi:inner membrane protein involved in colicin E2 resistance